MPLLPLVPDPPDFSSTEPLFTTWSGSEAILRVFNPDHGPTSFNPGFPTSGIHGRFHFFQDPAAAVVPVLYGSDQGDGAISETIFHDVPIDGPARYVPERRLGRASIVSLRPTRDLRLVQLLGHGLRRLRIRAGNLTDTDPAEYPRTVPWAQSLHRNFPDVDGLVWMSRQFNSAKAVVLFGDRVASSELQVVSHTLPLRVGPGRALVDRAANQADIVLI